MLQPIWIILVLIAAPGWALAETTDDMPTKEQLLQVFDDVQADEIVFESAKNLLILRGNVQLGGCKGRADGMYCDLDRKALTIMIRDHELHTDESLEHQRVRMRDGHRAPARPGTVAMRRERSNSAQGER